MTALPKQDALFEAPAEPEPTPPRPEPKKKTPPPRETDGCCAIYLQATGSKYGFRDAIDGKAWAWLRQRASVEEIEERWRLGLAAKGWHNAASLAQLASKWNELGVLLAQVKPKAPASQPELDREPCAACGAPALQWFCRSWLCTSCVRASYVATESVPPLAPRPTKPGDVRIRAYLMAQDAAVAKWARECREVNAVKPEAR